MRRGFKTEAERLADRTRAEPGFRPHVHMPIRDLAVYLEIEIYPADQQVDRVDLDERRTRPPPPSRSIGLRHQHQ